MKKRLITKVRYELNKFMHPELYPSSGINYITLEDVFIVSYPKSGNTWVRFIVANLIEKHETISFRNIENYVQDIHKSLDKINSIKEKRYIKSHFTHFNNYKKCIYIYRDGRDATVSFYHYCLDRKMFFGTFSEFLLSKYPRYYGSWSEHVNKGIDNYLNTPSKNLLLKYENMLSSPRETIVSIAQFINIEFDDKLIDRVLELSSFHNLKENEKTHGSEFNIEGMKFFREGKANSWRDLFTKEDYEYFLLSASNTLLRTGYNIQF